jgi:hypothetical protein
MKFFTELFDELKTIFIDYMVICDLYMGPYDKEYKHVSSYGCEDVYDDDYVHYVWMEHFANCCIWLGTQIFYFFFRRPDEADNIENEEKVDKSVVKMYDDKYDDKYETLEAIPLEESDIDMLSNKFVMESTPVGNVVMYFDYDKRAFQYYSDFSVPYKYLECVSKKYCIVNKNKVYREIKMEVDVNEFSIVRNSSYTLQTKSKSFAKLKSYNNSTPRNPTVKNHKQEKLKIIQKDIVRYTHLGKLCNFSFVKNDTPKFKPISYKDFMTKQTSRAVEDWVLY